VVNFQITLLFQDTSGQIRRMRRTAFSGAEIILSITSPQSVGYESRLHRVFFVLTRAATQCRFLIKRLINHQISYEWLFMAFSTLWYISNGKESQILLCFDLSEEITDMVMTNIKASNPTVVLKCPFAIYDILLSPISRIYDESLWEFRIPIRDIEKVWQTCIL
jgi:hypothetical protein